VGECGLADSAFPDSSSLATALTQVEETGTSHSTAGDQFDLFDAGIVQRKGFFNPYAMGNFADSVRGVHVTAFALDDDTLKHLNTFLAAFDDADMHLNGVSGPKFGMIEAHLLLIYLIDYRIHDSTLLFILLVLFLVLKVH
jgi:hypothetical protein